MNHNESGRVTLLKERLKGPYTQDDPLVLEWIREGGILQKPSISSYNLDNPDEDPSEGQAQIVKKLFSNKTGGFFVECGAWDGETRSNTLSLERDLQWQGLLIEADADNFEILLSKRRKAWASQSCLSVHPYPHDARFFGNYSTGRVVFDSGRKNLRAKMFPLEKAVEHIQCFPLFSFLLALNRTEVDYLSLDVEGSEEDVIQTIPFHLVSIKVLSIELTHGLYGRKTSEFLKVYMKQRGYKFVTRVISDYSMANDLIFAHKDFQYSAQFPDELFYLNKTLMNIYGKQ
ncbi:unnamed protein product [Allacma fusca]|uniref:Methyltransferase FkbM domain-containing protein n=1 Tax=Allacma fusca TaxID=39272 RepID=A0A8J2LD77_9HEXA|nr:unnamed protein product [Allacma fusca]